MNLLNNFLKLFLVAVVILPGIVFAQEVETTTGFVGREIWYSYQESDSDPILTLYTLVVNGEESMLEGVVRFYDGPTLLGEKSVSVESGKTTLVEYSVDDTKTVHSFFAKLEDAELSSGEDLNSLFATDRLYLKTAGVVGLDGAVSLPPESFQTSVIAPFVEKPLLFVEWIRFGLGDFLTKHTQAYWAKEELTTGGSIVRGVLGAGMIITSMQGLFYVVAILIIWGLFASIRRMFFGR